MSFAALTTESRAARRDAQRSCALLRLLEGEPASSGAAGGDSDEEEEEEEEDGEGRSITSRLESPTCDCLWR